jgi:hypothetical protein
MDYPTEFSRDARAAVETEMIKAWRRHNKAKEEWDSDWPFDDARNLRACVMRVFLVYALEAIELGRRGVWGMDKVRAVALEGLRRITIDATYKVGDFQYWIDGGYITLEIQRGFEAMDEWREFEDELLELAKSRPGQTKEDLPELSESAKRKRALQWITLLDKHGLTDEQITKYDIDRNRAGKIAVGQAAGSSSRAKEGVVNIGLGPSVRAAEERFRGIDHDYWLHWCASGAGYETYERWLENLKREVLAELRAIWKGRSHLTDRWHEKECRPAVDKALAALLKQRIKQARDVEVKRLDSKPSLSANKPPPGETNSASQGAAMGAMENLQELPPKLQNVFEAAKVKAELAYATRAEAFPNSPQLANSQIHDLKLIQDVLFAYCAQARERLPARKLDSRRLGRRSTTGADHRICRCPSVPRLRRTGIH